MNVEQRLLIMIGGNEMTKEKPPKVCEVCGDNIEEIHPMYKRMGFCVACWEENAEASHEEWEMTGEVIGRW